MTTFAHHALEPPPPCGFRCTAPSLPALKGGSTTTTAHRCHLTTNPKHRMEVRMDTWMGWAMFFWNNFIFKIERRHFIWMRSVISEDSPPSLVDVESPWWCATIASFWIVPNSLFRFSKMCYVRESATHKFPWNSNTKKIRNPFMYVYIYIQTLKETKLAFVNFHHER